MISSRGFEMIHSYPCVKSHLGEVHPLLVSRTLQPWLHFQSVTSSPFVASLSVFILIFHMFSAKSLARSWLLPVPDLLSL